MKIPGQSHLKLEGFVLEVYGFHVWGLSRRQKKIRGSVTEARFEESEAIFTLPQFTPSFWAVFGDGNSGSARPWITRYFSFRVFHFLVPLLICDACAEDSFLRGGVVCREFWGKSSRLFRWGGCFSPSVKCAPTSLKNHCPILLSQKHISPFY